MVTMFVRALLFVATVTTLAGISSAGPPLQNEEVRGASYLYSKWVKADGGAKGGKAMLPVTVQPVHYTLALRPILYTDETGTEFTAPGNVTIRVRAVNASNYIVLHKHPTLNVPVDSVKLTGPSGDVTITTVENDSTQDTMKIEIASNLVVGQEYSIVMAFVAPISASTAGLYRAQYEDPTKNPPVRRMATTQFESYGARQVFPCFDEPRFKTNFTISLGHKTSMTDYSVITNGAVIRRDVPDDQLAGWVWDIFETTVEMPTYLVAIVVSDFEYVNATEGLYSKPVRIYGTPAQIQQNAGQIAADASATTLKYLEQKFDFEYELSKMDSVAVPRDYFAPGAMENWGLVTYRDDYLLYFVNETTETTRQLIYSVIAHEFAHQWFGNLVTCKYWSHIWLNEGFATYVANLVLQQEFKEYDDEREMLWGSVQSSMASTSEPNYPILNPEDPLDGNRNPSVIIYDKAGSIVRMMEGFLTEPTLTAGLRKYLKKYAYQAAEQDELWEVLNEQAHEDERIPADKTIKEIMDTWTTQPGHPLLRVGKITSGLIYISQEAEGKSVNAEGGLWEVPVAIATKNSNFSDTRPTVWISKNQLIVSHEIDATSWIILNPNAYGYYRVLYDEDLSQLIQEQLVNNRSSIGGLSRSQLIDDYFALLEEGQISVERALGMTLGLKDEDDFVVWYSLFTRLQKTLNIFRHEDLDTLKAYLAPSIEAALTKVSWNQDQYEHGTRVIYRSKLVDWACALESSGCQQIAADLLNRWTSFPADNPIGLDLQPALYCAIVSNGGRAGFDFIMEKFRNSATTAFQKDRFLQALTCVRESALVQEFVNMAVETPSVVANRTSTILRGVASSTSGRNFVLNYILNNATFDALLANTGNVNAFLETVRSLSTYLTTESQLNMLTTFTDSRVELSPPAFQNSLRASYDLIRANIEWIAKYYGGMKAWFEANRP